MREKELKRLGEERAKEAPVLPAMSPAQIVEIAKSGGGIMWHNGILEHLSIGPEQVILATNARSKKAHRMALHTKYHCVKRPPLAICPRDLWKTEEIEE